MDWKVKKSFFNMELLVLSPLVEKDCYGYEIASTILEKSGGVISIKEGALYPILTRLKEEELVSYYEKIVNKKIRVYYHLEEKGILYFCSLKEDFYRKYRAIDDILKGVMINNENEC